MRVVVTGGAGFIGSALCRHLVLDRRWEVINIDKLTYAASLSSLRTIEHLANYRFVKADICDQATVAQVLASAPVDAIMHLAAESHVDRSIAGPAAFVTTNVAGTFAMLEAAREYWQQLGDARRRSFRFLHVSTDEVFGTLAPEDLFTETTAYAPRSPYSATKAASDHLVAAWQHTYGLPVLMTNCSNNYGPYQFPEKLVPLMILNALEMKPLPVYGDGRQERDWLFVGDHVQALTCVLESGVCGETYNIGGRAVMTNIDLVERICDILDRLRPADRPRRSLITFVPDRPGHDRRYAIDPGKIEEHLGWRCRETFEIGLMKTVEWYLANETWWRPLRNERFTGERLGLLS